jgi:hypothetical protein
MKHEGATMEPNQYAMQTPNSHQHFQNQYHHLLENTQLHVARAVQAVNLGSSGNACVAAAEHDSQNLGKHV